MDANIINTVASGAGITCPNCNTMNEADSLFCFVCGTKLADVASAAFEPVAAAETATAFEPVASTETVNPFESVGATEAVNPFESVGATETTNAFEPVNVIETVKEDEKKEVAPAFTPVNEVKAEEPEVKAPEVVKPVNNYVEPESVFAQGLPEWSVEPPQVVVRRRKKI